MTDAQPLAAPTVRQVWSRPWLGALLLLAAFILLVAVIGPGHETPVQDDWDYARSVRIFMERGVFARSEIAQAAAVFTTVWGALFARVGGFSFVTLRFSTLTLSVASLLTFYALLGELGLALSRRLLGTAIIMACPLFLFLSHSFMTDVPTLFWEVGALTLYLRAWRRSDIRLAVLASLCVAVATLTRQIGLVVGLAAAAYALVYASPGRRLRWAAACGLLPVVVTGVYVVWLQLSGGVTWANRQVTLGATLALLSQPQAVELLVRRAVIDLLTLGLYTLPAWLALIPALGGAWLALRRSRLTLAAAGLSAVIIAAVVVRLAAQGLWMPYLTDALTAAGLRPYLGYFAYEAGAFRPNLLPLPFWVALTGLAAGLGWLLAVVALRAARTLSPLARWADPTAVPGRALVYWVGLALAAATLLFGEFYERFLLLLLPLAVILILDRTRAIRLTWLPALLSLGLMAGASVLLLHDYWGWMDVRWSAAQALVDRGVPVELIDGGYEWNASHLYDAAIDHIRTTGAPMTIAPWLTLLDPVYVFSFAPMPGYAVAQDLTFPTPFGPAHSHLYLLRRDQGSGGRATRSARLRARRAASRATGRLLLPAVRSLAGRVRRMVRPLLVRRDGPDPIPRVSLPYPLCGELLCKL